MSFIAEPTDFGFSSVFGNGQPPPGHGRPQGGQQQQQQRRKLLEKNGKKVQPIMTLTRIYHFQKIVDSRFHLPWATCLRRQQLRDNNCFRPLNFSLSTQCESELM